MPKKTHAAPRPQSAFEELLGDTFDDLVDEIHKSLSTEEDDQRIAEAADDGDDDRESHLLPSHRAMLEVLRKITEVLQAHKKHIDSHGGQIKALTAQSGSAKDYGQPMTKALRRGDRVNAEVFMAKALDAQLAGRIDGRSVAVAEACINAGKAPPQEIIEAVISRTVK